MKYELKNYLHNNWIYIISYLLGGKKLLKHYIETLKNKQKYI